MKRLGTLFTVFTLVGMAVVTARADEVTDWEHLFLNANVAAGAAPYVASRYAAILHAAVFDAVNGVDPKYAPVHVQPAAPPGASVRAAAIMAAYTVLINIYPAQKTTFDAALPGSLAGIASGKAAEHSVSIQRGI